MFTSINEFVKEFESESAITERVLDSLTDESLGQAVTAQHRTLGRIAWHLVLSFNYMTNLGLTYDEPLADNSAPSSAAAITGEYRRLSQSFLRAVRSQWTDESLGNAVNMFGEDWLNGASLRYSLRHEIHHRGQMTVLMRQAGLRVPDVLGSTRDDWIDRGKEPLA
ncbi:DinB family protein [Cohnella suwonensis]|uniref:DinB family protein n=1 Tax=Cohnella suwonensis TaxID=696072 RepID=A0ABW0M3H9_9BACL